MKKNLQHIQHQAKKHVNAHSQLKEALGNPQKEEKIGVLFVGTFLLVLLGVTLFMNQKKVMNFFEPKVKAPTAQVQTYGFQKGMIGIYKIENQTNKDYQNHLALIATKGAQKGASTASQLGGRQTKPETAIKNTLKTTTELSTGQVLTQLPQKQTKALQKSILSTFYLGEKTIDLNSTLQTDSKILGQIKNTLEVNVFQYLNQSANRADSLQEYLSLLETLLEKTNQRQQDLGNKIRFLVANFEATEQRISLSEQAFFDNLQILDGPNAEEKLGSFIGLQEAQVETRAKIGAYQTIYDYYGFFKPHLENLITAIKANRDPLIAGVKVVEIENMSLPLIIRSR